jgi:DNA-binding LacI/PurR family transcriptional regulator
VPGDVAVIGCDDSPMAAVSSPPLSSVRFGSTGTHILADAVRRVINGETLPRQITLGRPFVVCRESA